MIYKYSLCDYQITLVSMKVIPCHLFYNLIKIYITCKNMYISKRQGSLKETTPWIFRYLRGYSCCSSYLDRHVPRVNADRGAFADDEHASTILHARAWWNSRRKLGPRTRSGIVGYPYERTEARIAFKERAERRGSQEEEEEEEEVKTRGKVKKDPRAERGEQ